MWLEAYTVSSLTRGSMQTYRQRRSLNQSKRFFLVFVRINQLSRAYACSARRRLFKKMPSRSTIPVYKGISGDSPLHFPIISRHRSLRLRRFAQGSALLSVVNSCLIFGNSCLVGKRWAFWSKRWALFRKRWPFCCGLACPRCRFGFPISQKSESKWKQSETSARSEHPREPLYLLGFQRIQWNVKAFIYRPILRSLPRLSTLFQALYASLYQRFYLTISTRLYVPTY